MRLKGQELDNRLEAFSHDTLVLISKMLLMPREMVYKSLEITTNSELTEEQVVEQLKKLKAEYEARSSR